MDDLSILFEKYEGKLSLEEISKGIKFCLENATALLIDAEILFRAKRYPRSLSLLLTAIQEVGKVTILKKMIMISIDDTKSWKKLWSEFKSHPNKDLFGYSNKISINFSTQPGEAFWHQLLYKKNYASAKEKIRQLSLYSDYISYEKRWWSPEEITEEIVQQVYDDVINILYQLLMQRKVGFFSERALQIYKEEFTGFSPNIEFEKEYDTDDFGQRLFGLEGPFKKYFKRLISEGVIKDVPDDLMISGIDWKEFVVDSTFE